MKDRALLLVLICGIPIAAAWLLYRSVQWERRRGFHGRYDQPIEPSDLHIYGVGSDRHPSTHVH